MQASPNRAKESSQAAVLRVIYNRGPISRAEIREILGLSLPTVTTAVNKLLSQGVIEEGRSFSAATYGRKTHALDIVPTAGLFAGVEMRGSCRAAVVTDFRGSVLYRAVSNNEQINSYEQSLQKSCALLRDLLSTHGVAVDDLSGIGVCIPGLVDSQLGVLHIHPGYGWKEKSVCQDVAAVLQCRTPIYLENNACARSEGAQLFHRDVFQDAESFAYLFIASGIACPLVVNHAGLRSLVGAGEVGHMIMQRGGRLCACGNRGCLEAYASDLAVIEDCQRAVQEGKAPVLQSLCEPANMNIQTILQAQAAGDVGVQAVVTEALTLLGLAVVNIANFSSPDLVFIEGRLFALECNRGKLLQTIQENLYGPTNSHTRFEFMDYDPLSGALGAAAVAISRHMDTLD